MWRLARCPDRQARAVGNSRHRARLHGGGRGTGQREALLNHDIRLLERIVDVPETGLHLERQIIRHIRPDAYLISQGRLGVYHRFKWFPLHLDRVDRIGDRGRRLSQNHRYRLTHKPRNICSQRSKAPGTQALRPLPDRYRTGNFGKIGSGIRGDDPGHRAGTGDVDGKDARVRVGAPHEARMEHAGKRQVPDIPPLTAQEPRIFHSWNALPDVRHLHFLISHGPHITPSR